MAGDSFTYEQFEVMDDRRTVNFYYSLHHAGETHQLTEQIVFPVDVSGAGAAANSLRALHLALGSSYYKTFIPPIINQPYAMDDNEATFWNEVWHHGFGEFLYVNKLSSDQLARFTAQPGREQTVDAVRPSGGALLGIGGGKDSALAGEALKAIDVPIEGFVMATGEQLGQTEAVASAMGINLLVVNRQLDAKLFDLQERAGAYKGHVPISLVFGLVGCAIAAATGKQYVVVANESSASTPRTEWQGEAVNHQWSKSFGFETQLQAYVRRYIASEMTYFSAIRPLTSVAVAKIFAGLPQYFEVFTSDNYVFRVDPSQRPNGRWSLDSPKSLSSFILLSPWLEAADMMRIFGLNFLDQPELNELFKALVGIDGEPPLDCVGTVEELSLSLRLAIAQGKYVSDALIKVAHDSGLFAQAIDQTELADLLALQPDQAIPPDMVDQLLGWLADKVAA